MALAPKKLTFHSSSSSSSSSSSASVGSQKVNRMDEDDAISEAPASIALDRISTQLVYNQTDPQKHSEEALQKTQEQEDDSACVSNSKAQEVALLDENQTTEAGEKEGDEPALDQISTPQMRKVKTQEQGDSTGDPNSKIQEALSGENQTTEAGEKEGNEPALKKIGEEEGSNSNSVGSQKINTMDEDEAISTQQVHNQADQQIHSDAALEKTQEQEDDPISDSNSKAQEIALLNKNQTIESGEKEGEKAALEKTREQASSSGFDFQSLQKDKAIMVVESLNPVENPLESNKLTDIQESNRKKPLALFSQIFTDEDVIVLLQGMIDFKSMHGDKNMTDFYFFIKDKLYSQFTKIQITEKFRRLRKKFVGNLKKTTENGALRDFSNPHDLKVFELSNKLWGNDGCGKKPIIEMSEKTKRKRVEFGSKKEDKKQKGTVEDEVDIDVKLKYPLIHPSFNQNIGFIAPDMAMKNRTLKGSTNSSSSEAKWEKLKIKEAELYCEKLDLIKEMIGAALQSLKD